MQAAEAVGRIVELVRDLRKRCSWDAAQTRDTLRSYLIEEVFELDQALAEGDPKRIKDELGDLVLHLAFQIVLGEEAGQFGAEDVTKAIEAKMWRRHPHLFPGKVPADSPSPGHNPTTWEKHKRAERGKEGDTRGVLDGLPPSLPALIMAFRLQERAAGVGFDWPDLKGPLEKLREEIGELEMELTDKRNAERISSEIGDLLFSVVNVARKAGVDPRGALQRANTRFTERFRKVEALAAERGIDIAAANLETLDELWEEAKES